MLSEGKKLAILSRLSMDLSQIQDLDILMERILAEARRFANADAGSIYIREGDFLHFSYTQNDTLTQRLAPGAKLIYSTFTVPINVESIAGFAAATGRMLNIPDVYAIGATAPYAFSKKFDEASGYRTCSMLIIPLKNALGQILGILQIINAMDEAGGTIPFTELDEKVMGNFAGIAAVALERAQMTRTLLLRMIRMAEMRDPKETGAHVNRVGGYSLELYEGWAERHGISREIVEKNRDSLRMAAMLHDMGKVGISDMILKKPARLDEGEFKIMKQHTVFGAHLFLGCHSDFNQAAMVVALNHHERWDGKGYPGHINIADGTPLNGYARKGGGAKGKQRDEIPLFGRIVAVADVYDALSSKRIYKDAWDEASVLEALEQGAGRHFDPELIEIFIKKLDNMRAIQERYKDEKNSGDT